MTGTLHANTIEKANGDPVDLTGQYAAKVTWKYDQTTPALDASAGISSTTDHSTGEHTLNFSVTFADADYSEVLHVVGGDSGVVNHTSNTLGNSSVGPATTHSTTAIRCITQNSNGSNLDIDHSNGVIFGDLA